MKSIATLGLTREDWLTQRKVGLGSSDVAAALGINPYKTPYQLWKDKVSDEVEEIDNNYIRWGNYMEEPIAEEYMTITGRKVLRDNKIRIHPEHECLIANLDRIITDNGDGKGTGILECKSTVSFVYKTWKDETDTQSIPLEYFCQVQHQLSVTGYKWAILAVMVLDQRQCYFLPIERDEDYIQRQNKVLVAWWNAFVLNNVPPPMTAAEYSHSNVITGSKVDADRETEQIYFELKKQRLEKKKIEDEVKRLEDKIKTYLGENEILMIGDTIAATWKSITRKAYQVKESTFRQLRISE